MGSTLGGTGVRRSSPAIARTCDGHQASGGESLPSDVGECMQREVQARWLGSRGGCATTTPLYAAARGVENMFRRGRSQRAGSREARSRGAALGWSELSWIVAIFCAIHTHHLVCTERLKSIIKRRSVHTTPGASRAQEFLGRFQKGLPRRAQRRAPSSWSETAMALEWQWEQL